MTTSILVATLICLALAAGSHLLRRRVPNADLARLVFLGVAVLFVTTALVCGSANAQSRPAHAPVSRASTPTSAKAPPQAVSLVSLDSLVAAAWQANPSLEAIKARVQALGHAVHRAGAWKDPKLGVEYSNMPIDAWRPGEHPMSGIQLKLSQTFYYPGKIAARRAVVEGRVREARASLAERKVQLRTAVERAYYRLTLVRQLRQVTRDHIKLVDQFGDVVRVKYEVGKAGQHELIRLQVLGLKLRDDLKAFGRDEKSLLATLNATLHRRLDHAISTPAKLASLAAPKNLARLEARARRERPLLRQLSARAQTARAAAKQAAREGYPDITAWLGYRFRLASGADPGTDFVTLGVSIPLPFSYARRFGSQRHESQATARAVEAQRLATVDSISGALAGAVARWQRAAQKAESYQRKLMPLAHRALDATFAAYQVDRADFASLYQAELALLDFERAIRRAQVSTYLEQATVRALVGQRSSSQQKEAK